MLPSARTAALAVLLLVASGCSTAPGPGPGPGPGGGGNNPPGGSPDSGIQAPGGPPDGGSSSTNPPAVIPPPARPAPRPPSTVAGSCDGLLDYGSEFRITGTRTVGLTYPDPATVELDLDLDLRNVGGARYRGASVTPDLSALADLGVTASPEPLPADFGQIEPGASVSSTAPLRLRVPVANLDALLQRLSSGAARLVVHGEEINQLAQDVRLRQWRGTEDALYRNAQTDLGANPDPGPGPFTPGQEFTLSFFEPRIPDFSTVFDGFTPGSKFYLVEDPASPLTYLPEPFRYARVIEAEKYDSGGQHFTLWTVKIKLTDTESLPQLYTHASVCTGSKHQVDPPIQSSRVYRMDGIELPEESVEINSQPIRMNGLVLSKSWVTFSGQLAGHVLRPSLGIKIRDFHVEVDTGFDNDVSVSAELGLARFAKFDPDSAKLFDECFPLPDLIIGPVKIPMSLLLTMEMGMSGSIGGGIEMSFQKHWKSGVKVHCEVGPGVPQACSSASYHEETPSPFTPPHFVDGTGYQLRTEAGFRSLLRVGDKTCKTGPGVSLDAKAYAKVGLSLTHDPWWFLGYGLEVVGAVDLDVLDLDVARYESTLYSTEEEAKTSSMFPVTSDASGARVSGQDQRWSVVVDNPALPNGVDQTGIAVLPDGSSLVVATEPVGGRNPLIKLDASGTLVWVRNFGKKVLRIHALPDGTAIAVGANAWLARVDGDGNLLWSWDGELGRPGVGSSRCVLADVAALEQAPGVYDYVAVGKQGTSLVTTVDGCAFRVRDDGTLGWSRIYVGDSGQQFTGVTATRDGNVAALGTDTWEYVGHRQVPLIARLDASTGDLIWAKRLPMTRYAYMSRIVEAEDGTLFAAGGAQGIITSTAAAFVVRIAADGSDVRHAMYFEDQSWELALDSAWTASLQFGPYVDTAGGDTAYDSFLDIAPSGDGFVLAGFTGLGAATAARVARVNAKLGVEWISVLDGPSTDALTALAVTDTAVVVSGYSSSLPHAGAGSADNQVWVTKLPVTGSVTLLPETGMTVRYSAPGVRASSTDANVVPVSDTAIDAVLTRDDHLLLSAGPNPGLLGPGAVHCARGLTANGTAPAAGVCL